jgi:NitT/TauT family transport system substrate-binding protein
VVLRSDDVLEVTQSVFSTTVRFAEKNPKLIEAFRAASREAVAFIHADPEAALRIYREFSGDTTDVETLKAVLSQPGMMRYKVEPAGTMVLARHLFRAGIIRSMPTGVSDYFLPADGLAGD